MLQMHQWRSPTILQSYVPSGEAIPATLGSNVEGVQDIGTPEAQRRQFVVMCLPNHL